MAVIYTKTRELTIGPAGTALSIYHLTAHQNIDAEIQDISAALSAITYTAPTAYSSTWTCTSGAAPVIGNGSIGGVYTQIGKHVSYQFYITFGSSTTFGGGNWRFTLPVTASSSTASAVWIGAFRYIRPGVDEYNPFSVFCYSTTTFGFVGPLGTNFTASYPHTWASGHSIQGTITYLAE